MPGPISVSELIELSGGANAPIVVAVTRRERYENEGRRIPGALWRDHLETEKWGQALAARGRLVVHCAEGHNVSQLAVAKLRADGINAVTLAGGIAAWEEAGGLTIRRHGPDVSFALERPTVWVTRERPKIDRIACPWLIRRFIDPLAEFHYVAAEWVFDVAREMGGTAYDIEGAHYAHRGELCSFDALIADFGLSHPALDRLARIVRGADTARLDLAPEAAGLLAVSLGLSAIEADDLRQLERGLLIYDALYGWLRKASTETHNWPAARAK